MNGSRVITDFSGVATTGANPKLTRPGVAQGPLDVGALLARLDQLPIADIDVQMGAPSRPGM